MDALPARQAADVQPILRTVGGLALDPMTAAAIGARDSFIRPSNVVWLADWRRRRRAAR